MPFIAIAIFAVVALGGGVSFAADKAEPGSALYSYKVHVNDNVRAGARVAAEEFGNIGATLKSGLHLDTEAEAQSSSSSDDSDVEASTTVHSDANAKIKAEDAYTTDGTLRSDLDTKVHIDL